MKKGMILGRFQVFHNGHMRYLTEAMRYCDYLLIGITNSDPLLVKRTEKAPHRSEHISNPFTYYERMKMIQKVCEELEISKQNYDIVPVPLDFPENIKYYVPKDILIMVTIHDDWSLEKKKRLEGQGYKVQILFDEYGVKKISSTDIRKLIAEGKDYSPYVPSSVYHFLKAT